VRGVWTLWERRTRGAIAVLIVAAVTGLAGHLRLATDLRSQLAGYDFETAWFNRFEPVRRALAEMNVKSVGYVTLLDNRPAAARRAQYSLAPVVVWPDGDRPLVIADSIPAASLADWKLEPVRDLGSGLILTRRRQ